jgi:OTT_1508-like deaminase
VQLNGNRILGRLGSTRFQAPKHLRKVRKPLPIRLRQLFRKNIRASSPDWIRQDVERLDNQIGSFEAAFQQLESGKDEDIVINIRRAIEQAFELTENGSKLPGRLKSLGCPEPLLDTRDVREVGKVSNYWRISRHLAVCSQHFRPHFANAEWYPLPHYRASSKSRVLSRQYVHAEIQLLVHFELACPQLMPRVLGVSKEACFLCDSFIKAHGRFSVAGAHRQIFPKWTIPDLKEYDLQTIIHFREALSRVCGEVNEEYFKAQKKLPSRPFPLQSAINLNVIHLKTPSTSSLLLQPESHLSYNARTINSNNFNLRSIPSQAEEDGTLLEHDRDGNASREAISLALQDDKMRAPMTNRQGILAERPIDIRVDETISEYRDWVHVIASFSSFPIVDLQMLQQPHSIGGSVSLESSSGVECHRKIHLSEIPLDKELILERDSNDALHELSFLLVGTQEQKVRIRCRWHVS